MRRVDWYSDGEAARRVRREVFIDEQQVPEALEWDGWDERSVHVLAETLEGEAVGTARLLPDGSLGRMAVVRRSRGQGVGSALMEALLAIAHARGCTAVRLSAQTHAIPFYTRFGFEAQGPEYLDAGIPHRLMWRRLG